MDQDSQGRRYQVFVQEREGEPYLDAGTVHAPDIEMAMLNARDVFARRPVCVGMWVVPADAIYSCTAQELQAGGSLHTVAGDPPTEHGKELPVEEYYVFTKTRSAGTQTLAGHVTAGSPAQALQQAVEQFAGKLSPFVWWVFPARLVTKSRPQDIDSFFAPALNKTFRLSSEYRTLSAMRKIKERGDDHA